ncbi:MAG: T9SS type A sorting domain-containing protein [Bacteroidales bacterium]|nr:T9SS type A sorting domain-containing protein [Bacteroidales bacterium]
MKQCYLLILLSIALLSIDSKAQSTIESLEYWFDDYANVVSQSFTPGSSYTFNETISTEDLDNGLHQFSIRFKDDNNQWSAPVSQFFYKKAVVSGNVELVTYEYWFNDNMANAIGSSISSVSSYTMNQSIDCSSLNNGLHQFSIRFKDTKGSWSSPISHFIYKAEPSTGNNPIEAYQYWINDNMADAIDVPVSAQVSIAILDNLNFADLKAGTHQINMRFKDANGKWSSVISEEFLKVAISLDDNLIAHYPFNGNANDESGYDNHGTVLGATLVSDRKGNVESAYLFDGNDQIDIAHSDVQNMDGALSISCWIKPADVSSTSMILGKSNYYSTTNYLLRLKPDGFMQWEYQTYAENNSQQVLPGNWYHVVVTADAPGSAQKVYINNQLTSATNPGGATYGQTNSILTIGYAAYGGEFFNGIIDDVQIYNKALSSTEVSELYNQLATSNGSIIPLNNIKVYPIPAFNELTIELTKSEVSTISLFDSKGRMIKRYNKATSKYQLNVSDLNKGVYYIHIASESGVSTQKFIKE